MTTSDTSATNSASFKDTADPVPIVRWGQTWKYKYDDNDTIYLIDYGPRWSSSDVLVRHKTGDTHFISIYELKRLYAYVCGPTTTPNAEETARKRAERFAAENGVGGPLGSSAAVDAILELVKDSHQRESYEPYETAAKTLKAFQDALTAKPSDTESMAGDLKTGVDRIRDLAVLGSQQDERSKYDDYYAAYLESYIGRSVIRSDASRWILASCALGKRDAQDPARPVMGIKEFRSAIDRLLTLEGTLPVHDLA